LTERIWWRLFQWIIWLSNRVNEHIWWRLFQCCEQRPKG
jgi:hypothetical protein